MRVWALWHGGANYAVGSIDTDLEEFVTLEECKYALDGRRMNDSGQTPGVGFDSLFHVWFADPRDSVDPYPDRIIRFGTRGGLVIERA